MANEFSTSTVGVKLLDAKLDSHVDMCTLRYEAINARLKRLETVFLTATGAIIILLINIAMKVQ